MRRSYSKQQNLFAGIAMVIILSLTDRQSVARQEAATGFISMKAVSGRLCARQRESSTRSRSMLESQPLPLHHQPATSGVCDAVKRFIRLILLVGQSGGTLTQTQNAATPHHQYQQGMRRTISTVQAGL